MEIKTAIVRDLRVTGATVVGADQRMIGLGSGPTGADRQLGIQLNLDIAHIETHAPGRPGERRGETDCQWQLGSAPEPVD